MDKETALKILRELHDKALFSERTALETLHPELKESEDEKVRKEILDCFRTMKQQGCFPSKHKEQYDSWIAWLEKQGEQTSAWSEEDERICRAIICDIANDKSICKFEISKSICDEQINWLKSLKERIIQCRE